jgi:hypothetical protein
VKGGKFTPPGERIRDARHREASAEALAALMRHRTEHAMTEAEREQARGELLARDVLARAGDFHALTPDEQAAATVAPVILGRAALAASPVLQAWMRAGRN